MTRQETIDHLLRPIVWSWSSSIRGRQNLVSQRHKEVAEAYPLMSEDERAKARKWMADEHHSGLWD